MTVPPGWHVHDIVPAGAWPVSLVTAWLEALVSTFHVDLMVEFKQTEIPLLFCHVVQLGNGE